ncbi:MAG: hypothetical protein WC785_01575 [Tatlockia sp.]
MSLVRVLNIGLKEKQILAAENKVLFDNLDLHFQGWLEKLSPKEKDFWQQVESCNLKTNANIISIVRGELDPSSLEFFSRLNKKKGKQEKQSSFLEINNNIQISEHT